MDLSILGKEISEVKENDFFKIFSKGLKEYKAFENDIDCHYYSEENGIDFIFENNILVSIHFSGRNDNKYNLFKGELPFNINILDDKIDVSSFYGVFTFGLFSNNDNRINEAIKSLELIKGFNKK